MWKDSLTLRSLWRGRGYINLKLSCFVQLQNIHSVDLNLTAGLIKTRFVITHFVDLLRVLCLLYAKDMWLLLPLVL